MTDYSKYTIDHIWQKRKITKVDMKSRESELTHRGNGIFICSSTGNVLADLRLESERIFLGHIHPLWVKINEYNDQSALSMLAKVINKGDMEELNVTYIYPEDFILQKSKLAEVLISKNKDDLIVLKDCLLCLESGFDQIQTSAQLAFEISILDLVVKLAPKQAVDNPTRQEVIAAFLLNYLNSYIFEPEGIKNKNDRALLGQFAKKYDSSLIGRVLLIPSNLYQPLLNQGVISSLVDNQTVLAFPLSCTEKEILDILALIEDVLEGASIVHS